MDKYTTTIHLKESVTVERDGVFVDATKLTVHNVDVDSAIAREGMLAVRSLDSGNAVAVPLHNVLVVFTVKEENE